ncbi:Dynein regulatory complex protein 11 [Eumeta japonica]|uniref:Dynein regulatory complex protein 11 n=1 Tax=Eumeta variegata TaxID=151549 RepID=A0A4C1TA14_EUMVA|nr:Dynein regulatory complex protein 11 [Eumeta japonica]
MQHIADEILAGNRLGDPTPTPSEILRKEEERLAEEKRVREEKEAENLRRIAMGEEIEEIESAAELSPQELEELRLLNEYNTHVWNIQRMERSRKSIRELVHKTNKELNLSLELAGIKAPPPKPHLRDRAVLLIQMVYRKFMQAKRAKVRDVKVKLKLGMIHPSWSPPSAKIQLENVKSARRKLRQNFYEKWIEDIIKERGHARQHKTDEIMESIASEIRGWWQDWYKRVKVFDEFPWPEEGGSMLYTRGETFTPLEYLDWRKQAEKKQPQKPQLTKEQIKRLENDAKERQRKEIEKYKKSRLSPDTDPGFYIPVGSQFDPLKEVWFLYENTWKNLDIKEPLLNAIKGHIKEIIEGKAYYELNLELRPIVDDMMRLELDILKNALKADYDGKGQPVPLTLVRDRPKIKKSPKKDKSKPAVLFQKLVDEGPKGLKDLFMHVNKIARFMQPTVILINDVEKTFYKRVPPEEKFFDPTRLQKDFYKQIVKGLKGVDKILVIGLASEPWLSKGPTLQKSFPGLILLPRSDYGTMVNVLSALLMKYHGVDRFFNYHSVAQVLRGYDLNAVKEGVANLMNGERIAKLVYKPLEPVEVINAVMSVEDVHYLSELDYEAYKNWYKSYSRWGPKFEELREMIASQLEVKLKNDEEEK